MFSKIITIEGNIGSGKSTLLEHLKQKYKNDSNIVFLREPVDEWESIKDESGTSMLQKFYADQEKYSFPFQMMAYISRLALFKDAMIKNPNAIIITERCFYTDNLVFAKMLYDMKKIEHINYQIYLKWFNTFAKDFPINQCIYVKTDPVICHDRIMTRSRTGEDVIPLDYLIECGKYHDEMIEKHMQNIEIILIDGNTNIYLNPEEIILWVNKIDKLIYNK